MDSISPELITGIEIEDDSRVCCLRSTEQQMRELNRLLYHRYPHAEWGTFFRFGYRITRWGILITLIDLLTPGAEDFDKSSHVMEFRSAYIGRALATAGDHEFGIGFIHSHPEGCRPAPSFSDNDMDFYLSEEFEKFTDGRPYVSLIVSRDENGKKTFSGRCYHKGKWLNVEEWLVCGREKLSRQRHYRDLPKTAPLDPSRERAIQLLGQEASERLQGSRVGIVGCSGLGTPAAHILARAGVGEFVIIDPGYFKPSNLERNHASRFSDLEQGDLLKVDLLERLIHEISPDAKVYKIAGDILDPKSVDSLSRCDLILSCTDSYYARAALGDLTTHYLLPVIDLAVQMDASKSLLTAQVGEVSKYTPGLPCPWCRNRVDSVAIKNETASDEERAQANQAADAAAARGDDGAQYWRGGQQQELTVGYMTTLVGSMGAGFAQHWLTGIASQPHDRFQFDLGRSHFGFASDEKKPALECSCSRCIGHADQGAGDYTVGRKRYEDIPSNNITV
jgi:hypothetical protein